MLEVLNKYHKLLNYMVDSSGLKTTNVQWIAAHNNHKVRNERHGSPSL